MSGPEKNLGQKIIDGLRKGAVAGAGVVVLSGSFSGCAPVEAQTTISNVDFPKETTTKDKPELEGVAPERLEFTKDLLNLYNKSSEQLTYGEFKGAFNKIKDFISLKQVIKYGQTGETGENLSIIKHKDGSPGVALINCNDNVFNHFNEMIKNMNKYDPDFLEKMTDNGTVAFMVNRFNESMGNSFTFNKEGLIVWNLKDPNEIRGSLERPMETECFGIKMYNLGGDYAKYVGFLKEQLSSDCWWNLYKKTGDEFCRDMSYSSYIFCKTYYNEYYAPVNFEDEKIQDLIKSARKLVTLFGGTEAEISESIKDRPDWNIGDIE